MRKLTMTMVLALGAAVAVHGEGVAYCAGLTDCWLGADFSAATVGETLTRYLGATGGDWGEEPVPDKAKAIVSAVGEGARFLSFSATNDNPIVFSAAQELPTTRMYSNFRMRFSAADNPLAVGDTGVQAAITMAKSDPEDDESAPAFWGYAGGAWVKLTSPVAAEFDVWYEGQVRFQEVSGELMVAYYLKQDGQLSALTDQDGNVWLVVGGGYDGEMWNEVGFKGTGAMSAFNAEYYGKGLRIDIRKGK